MTEWWEQAYRGGGPVALLLPRPMYPPDANKQGKNPSKDGPDVVAYKRAICRAGRWGEWDPASWDDSYSNAFAHGRGPNVKDTGVAGFQRQQHVEDTGWIGEKTFNHMCYALISDPAAPHYGEPIFDGECVRLMEKAYEMFGGSEPDEQQDTHRLAALDRARSQLGYNEGANNANKYGSWYGMNYQPWCAMFVTWCFEMEGDSPSFVKGSRYSYCPYVVGDARAGRYGLKTTDDPIPGDLVVYDWAWDTIYDHIGIFERWTVGTTHFNAIEGNTSTTSNSNGGSVMRRERSKGDANIVFIRVAES